MSLLGFVRLVNRLHGLARNKLEMTAVLQDYMGVLPGRLATLQKSEARRLGIDAISDRGGCWHKAIPVFCVVVMS